MPTDFQNASTFTYSNKFAVEESSNITPHLTHVATLPRETSISEKPRLPSQ